MAGVWKDVDRGYRALRVELMKLNDRSVVEVGVQGAQASAMHSGSKDRVTNAQVASWMEYGTVRNGEAHQPARPAFRPTIDEGGPRYYEMIKRGLYAVIDGKLTTQRLLALVGERVVADIKSRIRAGIDPPLSDSRIREKKSSKPWIDTGQLLAAITYLVRRKV